LLLIKNAQNTLFWAFYDLLVASSSLAFGTFQTPVSHVLTGVLLVISAVMARKWQVRLSKQITAVSVKYPFKEPFISKPADDDLTKQWVVEYGIWSEREQKLKRKRVVLKGDTVAQRLADGREVVAEVKKLLKQGACVDALQKAPTRAVDVDSVTVSTSIRKAIDVYLEYKKKTTKHNSWRTYRSSLTTFKQYLTDTPGLRNVALGNFHAGDAIDFLDQVIMKYGLSNRGHNNVKDNAGMFFRHWCKRLNRPNARVLLENPFEDIPDKRTTTEKHTAYTDDQRAEFKDVARREGEHQLLLFIQFMYYTFLRPRIELRLLRVADLKEQTIYVNGTNAKDNTGEHVQIPPPLERLIEGHKLRSYPPNFYVFSATGVPGPEPVGPDYFYQHHRRILERMGLKDGGYDMYSWKHTGVISLWNATQNIRLIQQQCRHSTAAQTEDYLRDLGIVVRHTQIQDFPEF
uniref:site-specific integrase n=1 Tax=Rudanella lutea TaxID=451374 RepID=UPI00036E0A9B